MLGFGGGVGADVGGFLLRGSGSGALGFVSPAINRLCSLNNLLAKLP